MALLKEKQIKIEITKDELGTLELIDSGILGNFKKLMDENETKQVVKSGKLNDEIMPFAYSFAPSLQSAQKILKNIKSNEKITLMFNQEPVGYIQANNVYTLTNPNSSIFTAKNICVLNKDTTTNSFAISGNFVLFNNNLIKIKQNIAKRIENINAKKVTAIMLTADPFHRLHERLIRMTIDKADFIIIFLVPTFGLSGRLDFDLRLECLEYVCQNFLPPEMICVVPFNNISLFSDHINPVLEAIAAKNCGANKLVIGQTHTGLGMYYDNNQANTLLDTYAKELNLELIILPQMFYCDLCHTIASSKSCPHGNHHHIKYHAGTIKQLLFAGIMPPAILMRPQISAIILNKLFGERFDSLQRIYDNLFPNQGIIEQHSQKDFYEKLMQLYQTVSLN